MNKKTGAKYIIKAFLGMCLLVCVLCAALAWRLARPEPAAFVFPAAGGGALLVARGGIGVASGASLEAPAFPFSLLARLRPTKLSWLKTGAPGGKAAPLDAFNPPEITPEPFGPVWDGADRIIVPVFPDKLELYTAAGRKVAEKRFEGLSLRALSMSRDGSRVAVSAISSKSSRGKSPFRLYVAPSSFGDFTEVNIDEIYPMLTSGSLEWAPDGALYFSGFDRGDHDQRATYRLDPESGNAPVQAGGDWGPVFSISPDGALAAAVVFKGLLVTNTTTGESRLIETPGESPSLTLPAWSPDGSAAAFMLVPKTGQPKHGKDGGPHIVVADPSSLSITLNAKASPGFHCGACPLAWSPSGNSIIAGGYTSSPRGGGLPANRYQILATDARTGETSFTDEPEKFWK